MPEFDALRQLPEHLAERTRVLHHPDAPLDGRAVVYWLRTAVRAHENPALDVAATLAAELKRPLLIYHALSQDYEFASDRHHRFILEGARDVQQQFAATPYAYAFHLETPHDDDKHLVTLAQQACVVVTEDMPTDPCARFTNALARQAKTLIVGVDTACIVPMQLVKKPYTRAFQYRKATKKLYAERLTRGWPGDVPEPQPFPLDGLPFSPRDLANADLAELIAECAIDHGVGPVPDTRGGSTAGYERWEAFKDGGLRAYAKRRNNAARDGVSRMSAYFHYGMVSPLRVAREAAELDCDGAEKYLDELLIWREMAYAFCHHVPHHDDYEQLPDWARETLGKHARDAREEVIPYERLMRGETGDRLWDAAQKSLVRQGELHNNVRMTWGKALLGWTKSPQEALRTIIDLNHRFALDGRDPASYGGILWCLGQFDRPFSPELSVIGTVRPRATEDHARRLDLEAYEQHVFPPRLPDVPRVAIVGAGLSGTLAGRLLSDHGCEVQLFEKSRGAGGRMSTRRADTLRFDHGAQYFTVRDPRFARYVEMWQEQDLVEPWEGPIAVFEAGERKSTVTPIPRYVAKPAMNTLCKHLCSDLPLRTQTRIQDIQLASPGEFGRQLVLADDEGAEWGPFDYVVISAPAGQTAELLRPFPELAEPIGQIEMAPCWTVMVEFERPLEVDWIGAFLHESPLSWVARGATRPGRDSTPETLVLHASGEWTRAHVDDDKEAVVKTLLDAFWHATGLSPQGYQRATPHRWMFAQADNAASVGCFYSEAAHIAACGDWANCSRVEGAFISGLAAAGRLLNSMVDVARLKPV